MFGIQMILEIATVYKEEIVFNIEKFKMLGVIWILTFIVWKLAKIGKTYETVKKPIAICIVQSKHDWNKKKENFYFKLRDHGTRDHYDLT